MIQNWKERNKERYPVFNKLFWPDWWMQSGKGGGGKTRTCWSNGPGWYHALTVLMLLWHWSYFISQALCSRRALQCLLTLGTARHVPPEQDPQSSAQESWGCRAAAPTPQNCKVRSFSSPLNYSLPVHPLPFLSQFKKQLSHNLFSFLLFAVQNRRSCSVTLPSISTHHAAQQVFNKGKSCINLRIPFPSGDMHSAPCDMDIIQVWDKERTSRAISIARELCWVKTSSWARGWAAGTVPARQHKGWAGCKEGRAYSSVLPRQWRALSSCDPFPDTETSLFSHRRGVQKQSA